MKQQDIAMLVLIVSISLIFSYFIGNALFGGEQNRSASVPVVEPISAEFSQPDETIFNEDAVNLVETINIGNTNNTNPFSAGE